jgi:hypothetical protein
MTMDATWHRVRLPTIARRVSPEMPAARQRLCSASWCWYWRALPWRRCGCKGWRWTTDAEGGSRKPAVSCRQQGAGIQLLGPLQAFLHVAPAEAMAQHQCLTIGDLAAGLAPHGVLTAIFGLGQSELRRAQGLI